MPFLHLWAFLASLLSGLQALKRRRYADGDIYFLSNGFILISLKVILKMTKPNPIPTPRMATLRRIVNPSDPEDIIDQGVVLYFEGPNSYTGEDCVELQVHGSISVIRDILASLSTLNNFKPSEPGEFTRLAWYNNKFDDLTMLEAVSDLIHSETSMQRKQALSQLQGNLGKLYKDWSDTIHKCLAHSEALIDFGDDEMIQNDITLQIMPKIQRILKEIESHMNDEKRGEAIRNGIQICLIGRPNAGKSSLMNLLAKRDVSIVSNERGTTRDVVETRLDMNGYPIILQDTAGLNESEDIGVVEKEGIRRSLDRLNEAHIRIVLIDISDVHTSPFEEDIGLRQFIEDFKDSTLVVFNKSDLRPNGFQMPSWIHELNVDYCFISCLDLEGVDMMLKKLTLKVESFFQTKGFEGPLMTRQRHRHHIMECKNALNSFFEDVDQLEIATEDLRIAGRCIAKITGRVDVEDLLEIIFKDFCIGK